MEPIIWFLYNKEKNILLAIVDFEFMASSMYYKFRSQKDESRVSFDGTGISVFDLKREIILANNLKANDCDLLLLDPSTEQGFMFSNKS